VIEYLALFAAAFVAATLVPFFSEVGVVGLIATGRDPAVVVVVASTGNTLGSLVNWILGRCLLRFEDRRWFPFPPQRRARAEAWFKRYGVWSLLLAWLPVVGDPLTFVAGLLRVPLGLFLVLVAIGKTARYLAVAAATLGLLG
jgi:membrane protein YqaA with SNARE-associated domain